MRSTLPDNLLQFTSLAVPVIVAALGLWAVRRYLASRYPVAAFIVASIAAAIGLSMIGAPGPAAALAPATAMIVTGDRPLSPTTWLRGAATLAVVLTVLAVLVAEPLMTSIAGALTAGLLCYLLGRASEAGSTMPTD